MKILKTPAECFKDITDFNYKENFIEVDENLFMHYVHENKDKPLSETILLLHGEPTWSYLYRKMIEPLVAHGYEVVAVDLIGFGKSDKPADFGDYTYQRHVDWLKSFLFQLKFKDITMFCQDWGGLLGLRILSEESQLFKRVIASNTFIATGDIPPNESFLKWQQFSINSPKFDIGRIVQNGTATELSDEVVMAYNAPFPNDDYKAGARVFPSLVPTSPNDPETVNNRTAIQKLMKTELPFLTAFGDSDPITKGLDKVLQAILPGAKGQKHITIQHAGHFIQEDQGEKLAEIIHQFIQDNP